MLYLVGLTVPDRSHTMESVNGVVEETLPFERRMNCVDCCIIALGTIQLKNVLICSNILNYQWHGNTAEAKSLHVSGLNSFKLKLS